MLDGAISCSAKQTRPQRQSNSNALWTHGDVTSHRQRPQRSNNPRSSISLDTSSNLQQSFSYITISNQLALLLVLRSPPQPLRGPYSLTIQLEDMQPDSVLALAGEGARVPLHYY